MTDIPFWKMHGLGNDYIIFDNRKGILKESEYYNFTKRVCTRRFSIGADGLIAVSHPFNGSTHFRMRIFNADGSEAEMCGNGIRCFSKYLYERNLTRERILNIETLSGIKKVKLNLSNGSVGLVSVQMGRPEFDRKKIPVLGSGNFINQSIPLKNFEIKASCLSMGNPHCVIFVNNINDVSIEEIGPIIEIHHFFPQRINVEFVEIQDRQNILVRTWERGVGETLACGTGACASAVISTLLNKTEKNIIVHLKGGELNVSTGDEVVMSGPASKVYEGVVSKEEHI